MVLEDRGEMLDSVDVMTVFGYRCLTCGHVEPSVIRFQSLESPTLVAQQLEIQHRACDTKITSCLSISDEGSSNFYGNHSSILYSS